MKSVKCKLQNGAGVAASPDFTLFTTHFARFTSPSGDILFTRPTARHRHSRPRIPSAPRCDVTVTSVGHDVTICYYMNYVISSDVTGGGYFSPRAHKRVVFAPKPGLASPAAGHAG